MDYSNTKYGKLQILERIKIKNDNHITYKAICECGNIVYIRATDIRNNKRKHCIHCSSPRTTHHKTNTKLFNVWQTMKQRCYYPKNKDFNNYGARGITVCDEWKNNFKSFYTWAIENNYREGLQIDRINVNGNYEPSNCRFVSAKTNSVNKRTTRYIEYKGITKSLREWADEYNISYRLLQSRLDRNWNIEKALFIKPVKGRNQHSKF